MKFAELKISQLVKQSRTGQVMKVKGIDSARGRATLSNSEGEARVVSATTLERWYSPVEAKEDVVNPQAEQPVDESDQNAAEEPAEDKKEEENMDQQRMEDQVTNDAAENQNPADAPVEEKNQEAESTPDKQPKAQKPPKAPKEPKPPKESKSTVSDAKIAETKRIRNELIQRVLGISPGIKSRETQMYTALLEIANFAEVYNGKGSFKVSVIAAALTPEQASRCKIAPASFNWTLDAMFTVMDEGDIEEVFNLIANSREYRLRNPLKRRPPVSKKQQAAAEAAQKAEAE